MSGLLSTAGEECGILPEELLQRLWIPASEYASRIGSLIAFFTLPECLPKMGEMIERVRMEAPLHRIGPLLVRGSHISNGPSDRSPQSFGHLSHGGSFTDQSVGALRRHARIGQQGC